MADAAPIITSQMTKPRHLLESVDAGKPEIAQHDLDERHLEGKFRIGEHLADGLGHVGGLILAVMAGAVWRPSQ